jgi:hypothetical protein
MSDLTDSSPRALSLIRHRGATMILANAKCNGRVAFIAVALLAASSANGAGPSTPEDWQKMYAACVEGAQILANQRGFSPDFPARMCGCLREELRKLPLASLDAMYDTIQELCLRRLGFN